MSTIKSFTINGPFGPTEGTIYAQGTFNTNEEKQLLSVNGSVYNQDGPICSFNARKDGDVYIIDYNGVRMNSKIKEIGAAVDAAISGILAGLPNLFKQ